MLNIAIIGKVSHGKSSFINSLVGYPISTVSLQRETFVPIKYTFERNNDENVDNTGLIERYKNDLSNNELLRENNELPELLIREIVIKYYFSPELDNIASITDYPGLDDSNDKRDLLEFLISNLNAYHLVIFVTQAESVFIAQSEVDIWNKLRDQIELQYARGSLCKLICLVSKYESDNEDLLKIYKKNVLSSQNGGMGFRWNAFNCLLQKVTTTAKVHPKIENELAEIFGNEWKKIKRYGSLDETFDFDGLCDYLSSFNVNELSRICTNDYYVNILTWDIKKTQQSLKDSFLYEKYISINFIEEIWNYSEKNSLRELIIKYLEISHYFAEFTKYVIFFKQIGFIEHIGSYMVSFLNYKDNWWTDDIVVNEIKKFIEEETEAVYELCPKYNNESFYIQNPLFNDFYRNWIYREFRRLTNEYEKDEPILLQFTPSEMVLTNKFVIGLYETYCKKNKAVILESSKKNERAVSVMRLCPTVFKHPTIYSQNPEKIKVEDMIEFIREQDIFKTNSCFIKRYKMLYKNDNTIIKTQCNNCRNTDFCVKYESKNTYKYICYFSSYYVDSNINFIYNQNYSPQEESLIINVIQKKNNYTMISIKTPFKKSWAYVDLNLFPDCKWVKDISNIKGWHFIKIFDSFMITTTYNHLYRNNITNSPMNELKRLRDIIEKLLDEKKFKFDEEFLDYCYEHQSEIIPQHLILNNCTF